MTNRGPTDWVNARIPAGRLAGAAILVHWVFPAAILFEGFMAGTAHAPRWGFAVALAMLVLVLIVLAHELGHVFAARREGSAVDHVVLWPLGGLTVLGEEQYGIPETRIAAAGPAVNLALLLLLLPVLILAGVPIALPLLNPFDWDPGNYFAEGTAGFLREFLFALFKVNLAVLLFNLVPAFPMDGGRILRGVLHGPLGPVRSVLAVTSVSLVCGTAMFVVAMIRPGLLLLGLIGLFLGYQAFLVRRATLRQVLSGPDDAGGYLGYDVPPETAGPDPLPSPEERDRRDRHAEEVEEDRRTEEEVDRLLDKIHAGGMGSLSREERAFLEQASRRKRG